MARRAAGHSQALAVVKFVTKPTPNKLVPAKLTISPLAGLILTDELALKENMLVA